MKRFFDKRTKKEFFLRKPIKLSYKDEVGNNVEVEANILTPDLAAFLVSRGILVVSDAHPEASNPGIPMDLEYYGNKIGAKLGLTPDKTKDFFNAVGGISPVTAWSLLMKQIALELDKKYPDHIRDSKHIFVVSAINGLIAELPKSQIRSYRNFAAFRSVEDARVACKLTRHILNEMFSDAR